MTYDRCDALAGVIAAELHCPLRVDAAIVPPFVQVMERVRPYCHDAHEATIARDALVTMLREVQ